MKSKILLTIVCLGIIGAFIGYKIYNKPHTDMTSAESQTSINATDLMADFNKDEASANEKHLDKVITVSGKIGEIKKEGEQTIVMLETADPLSSVICNLDPFSAHEDHLFTIGDEVRFKGICSGYLADVVIDRCVLIK